MIDTLSVALKTFDIHIRFLYLEKVAHVSKWPHECIQLFLYNNIAQYNNRYMQTKTLSAR